LFFLFYSLLIISKIEKCFYNKEIFSMSKKILSEGTIRRFMKLADIEPLSNTFIREGGMNYQRDDMAPEGEEPPMPEDEPMDEPPMPEDEPMDEPPMPEEEPGMEGEMSVTDEEAQVLIDLGKKLEGAAGGEEPLEEPLEEPMPEEEPLEEPMPEEEPEELEGLEELELLDDDEIMETVYRRVAARLVKEAKRG
jgi:hypothetical protein